MNPYTVLGLEPDADAEDIRAAFRLKAKTTHPDKPGGSDAAFKAVNEAHQILSDPDRRAAYDRGETAPGKINFGAASAVIDDLTAAFDGYAEASKPKNEPRDRKKVAAGVHAAARVAKSVFSFLDDMLPGDDE